MRYALFDLAFISTDVGEGHWFVLFFSTASSLLLTWLMTASGATAFFSFPRHEATKDKIEMLLQTVPDAQHTNSQAPRDEGQSRASPRASPGTERP